MPLPPPPTGPPTGIDMPPPLPNMGCGGMAPEAKPPLRAAGGGAALLLLPDWKNRSCESGKVRDERNGSTAISLHCAASE